MIEREIVLDNGIILNFHALDEAVVDFGNNRIIVITKSFEQEGDAEFTRLFTEVTFTTWDPDLLHNVESVIETYDLFVYVGVQPVTVETVESLKLLKKEQITDRKNFLEKQGFSFAGKIIESDLQSVVRIVTLSFGAMVVILFAMTGSTINWEPQPWTTADNSILMIDTPEMALDMHSHLMVFGADLHARATYLKAQVDAITSTDLEEVRGLLAAIPIE
jgi:hypothetical protein